MRNCRSVPSIKVKSLYEMIESHCLSPLYTLVELNVIFYFSIIVVVLSDRFRGMGA